MSVVLVRRVIEDSAQEDELGIAEVVSYQVVVDSIATAPASILSATDGATTIPERFSPHPTYPGLILWNETARRLPESPLFFQVDANYKAPPPTMWQPTPPAGDLAARWNFRLSVTGQETAETLDYDQDGNLLLNTAFEKFPLSATRIYYDEQLLLQFNSRMIDPALAAQVRGVVNDDPVAFNFPTFNYTRVFPRLTLKIGNISYETAFDTNGAPYFAVTFPLLYRSLVIATNSNAVPHEIGWTRAIADQGFRKLHIGIPPPYNDPILESNGTIKSEISSLDGHGNPIAFIGPKTPCVLLEYLLDPVAIFGPLLLGIGA